ncbi:MAG: hypothetical protein KKE17_15810 [Proteobacteria bacterium]|nr:hypothetical protein [Pseudomonadota bacterium]
MDVDAKFLWTVILYNDIVFLTSVIVSLWMKYFGIIDEINIITIMVLIPFFLYFLSVKKIEAFLRQVEKTNQSHELTLSATSKVFILFLTLVALLGTYSLVNEALK